MALERLISEQNPDGGWPYVRGTSWTEPTVYAILALLAAGHDRAAERGFHWLRSIQRPDGGWPPQPSVDESTWVTSLVALLPRERVGALNHSRAIRWLLRNTGKESSMVYRVRRWLLGSGAPREMDYAAWPWFPGTAAWVAPTSVSILALEKEYRFQNSPAVRARVESGRRFLLVRACPQGGWNHGGVPDMAHDAVPYPEVTGMALAALRGVKSPEVDRGIRMATTFLDECRSGDALNWLRLGLAAHGRVPQQYCPPAVAYRTLPEVSLAALLNSGERGQSLLWG
jgi:hypothetical protein